MNYFVGIDIGSTCAKTVVLDEQLHICHRILQPTGWSSVETAQKILASVLYSVSAELLRTGSHDAALAMLTEQSISVIHENGMARLMHTKKRAELLSLLLLRTQKSGMSRGYDQFAGRDAYRYVRSYNALYGAAEELYVQIPEMGIREICRGILRVTEIMTQVLKFNQC